MCLYLSKFKEENTVSTDEQKDSETQSTILETSKQDEQRKKLATWLFKRK